MADALTDAPSDAVDAPSDGPARPGDLIPTKEAARLVDRSSSTVRAWLRAGRLTKHREQPGNDASRVLVSRAELMAYAAGELDPAPPRPSAPRSALPTGGQSPAMESGAADLVELARLRAELEGARAVLAATRAHVASLEAQLASGDERVAAERQRADSAERHARELRTDLEEARDELRAARAESQALRAYAGLPWWRRAITGPVAALPDDS